MAERPANSFTCTGELDMEIRRVEEEVTETRLLHENLCFVHALAQDVLNMLGLRVQNNPNVGCNGLTNETNCNNSTTTSTSHGTVPSAPGPSCSHSRTNLQNCCDRLCACSDGQCQQVCMSKGTPEYQQIVNRSRNMDPGVNTTNETSGSRFNGDPNTTVTSGSTVADINVRHRSGGNSTYTNATTPSYYTGTTGVGISGDPNTTITSGSTLAEVRLRHQASGNSTPITTANQSELQRSNQSNYHHGIQARNKPSVYRLGQNTSVDL